MDLMLSMPLQVALIILLSLLCFSLYKPSLTHTYVCNICWILGAKVVIVIILWFLVGVVAFMLPPVPGPPIYLFGGVVCVDAFDNIPGKDGVWFW